MKSVQPLVMAVAILGVSAASLAQTKPSADTDVYHVMFVKALPGQAAAVATELQQQDPKDPMAGHVLLLRHQEGADWDYCLIQHVGQRATVAITPPAPNTTPPTRAWHNDTFVAGPSWAEFSKLMTGSASSVYVVSVHRAVPGRRNQLLEVLGRPDPSAKVSISHTTLTHLEGGEWQYLSLDRYNSWQDFGTDHTATAAGGQQGWLEIRQNSVYHTDTLASRVAPK